MRAARQWPTRTDELVTGATRCTRGTPVAHARRRAGDRCHAVHALQFAPSRGHSGWMTTVLARATDASSAIGARRRVSQMVALRVASRIGWLISYAVGLELSA